MSTSHSHPSMTITSISAAADEGNLVRVRQLRTLHAPKAGRWPIAIVPSSTGAVLAPLAGSSQPVTSL